MRRRLFSSLFYIGEYSINVSLDTLNLRIFFHIIRSNRHGAIAPRRVYIRFILFFGNASGSGILIGGFTPGRNHNPCGRI